MASDEQEPDHEASLGPLQDGWLSAGHILATAEHVYEFSTMLMSATCEINPENICVGIGCVNNPVRVACEASGTIFIGIAYGVLVAATVAFQATDHVYEKATLGADAAIYGYEYSQATYINTKRYSAFNIKALTAIRDNMLHQHKEMKRQLQERHKDIANHVGQDIADAQNALGEAIVDAQNQLGQGIVDAQNTLGNYIVNAQNANGELIVETSNYITLQHNKLSQWLHNSLCIMFEKDGGKCNTLIGPLEEDQVVVPVELVWPENQPTILERLEQIQTTFSSGATARNSVREINSAQHLSVTDTGSENSLIFTSLVKSEVGSVKSEVKSEVGAVKSEVGAVKSEVGSVKSEVGAVKSEVGSVKSEVGAVKDKVNSMDSQIQEMKDMISGLEVAAVKDEVKSMESQIQEMKDMISGLFELMGGKFSKE